jgi:Zn ribbon nucleic-acid-binding protein
MPLKAYQRNFVRLYCPKCEMGMIVVAGFGGEPELKTFECLRCGHIEKPQKQRSQAAE